MSAPFDASRSSQLLERLALSETEHIPLLIVWPRAEKYLPLIAQVVSKYFPEGLEGVRFAVRAPELERFTLLTYFDHPFAEVNPGVVKKARESIGTKKTSGFVRILLCPPGSQSSMHAMKAEIRKIWSNRYGGVHTTDYWTDSFRIFSSASNSESLQIVLRSKLVVLREGLKGADRLATQADTSMHSSRLEWQLSGGYSLRLLGMGIGKNYGITPAPRGRRNTPRTAIARPAKTTDGHPPRNVAGTRRAIWFGGVQITNPLSSSEQSRSGRALWFPSWKSTALLAGLDTQNSGRLGNLSVIIWRGTNQIGHQPPGPNCTFSGESERVFSLGEPSAGSQNCYLTLAATIVKVAVAVPFTLANVDRFMPRRARDALYRLLDPLYRAAKSLSRT